MFLATSRVVSSGVRMREREGTHTRQSDRERHGSDTRQHQFYTVYGQHTECMRSSLSEHGEQQLKNTP